MEKKVTLLTILVILLLAILCTLLVVKITPPSSQYKEYVITGEINIIENAIGEQPKFIYAYFPYYVPQYLCRSSDIQLSKIQWIDNISGNFEIVIQVPIGLSEIMLTTDCASCNYKTVKLAEISKSIDLTWGAAKCENDLTLSNQKTEVLDKARDMLNNIEEDLVKKPFNTSEIDSIKEDVKSARGDISESDRLTGYNESLLQAYYAYWFAWKSRYNSHLFDLKYCLEDINNVLENYQDNGCYVPEYLAYKDYSAANKTYFALIPRKWYNPYEVNEIGKMKEAINSFHYQMDWVSEAEMKCENSLKIINETFEFQKPYCKTRNISLKIAYLLWAIIFIYIGIFIEKGRKIWKK